MEITELDIKGCFIIKPTVISDNRGGFMRTFCEEEFSVIRKDLHFRQINHSFNTAKGTFRGMHYQDKPHAEEKLIRCVKGSVIDILLDIRKNSPTFMKHYMVELSVTNKKMIFLPKGVAHGFLTLENETELIYHHTEKHHSSSERGINIKDPITNIILPASIEVISEKDLNYEQLGLTFNGIEI